MSLLRVSALAFSMLSAFLTAAIAQSRTVAITVDDLPFISGNESRPMRPADAQWAAASNLKLLLGLARHHVPVTGLVIEKGVEELGPSFGKQILHEWTQRGFDLGNHTYSHPNFNDTTVEEFEKEIVNGEKAFVPLMQATGRDSKFFRFPYNHTGDTKEKHDAVAAFLKQHGYRVAPCTIEDEDWLFNRAYFRAHELHDDAMSTKVRSEFLTFVAAEIDYYAALTKQALGYEPPEIMLMHDNPLNADMIDELLALFEKRGYTFVSLAQAEADPVYQKPDVFLARYAKYGPMWGYRWAEERGVKVDGSKEPDAPKWIVEYGKSANP